MRDSALRPKHTASLTIEVRNASTGELTPARMYLFRSERPHRLSPVDNLLPLFEDNFHRERIWQMTDRPRTLEINVKNQWHHLLLEGAGTFDVPAWADYRVEAYHGLFWEPGAEKFALAPEETRTVVVKVKPIAPGRRGLRFESESQREKLMRLANETLRLLEGTQPTWPGK